MPDPTPDEAPDGGPAPQPCALCGREYHAEEATEPDEYGLLCPGALADEEARLNYIYRRAYKRDEAKMEDKEHWAVLEAEQALAEDERKKAIERGEARSEITYAELQADCDTRVTAMREDATWKGARWLTAPSQELAAAQLRDEELAEGLHIDPPHLTVPGKPPAPEPIKIVTNVVTPAEIKAAEGGSDYELYLNPDNT